MAFLRWILRVISGLTQFALYSLLFFLLMTGAGYFVALQFFGGDETKAPDLNGLSTVQALELLKESRISLQFEGRQPHVQIPPDHIISQFPTAGSVIKANTPIRVIISSGSPMVSVPDLRGRNKIEAGIRLRKLGFEVGTIASIPREGVPPGTILTSDPPAGAGAVEGARINLLLSAGEGVRTQQMPNLIGLSEQEASEVLASYNLSIAESSESPGAPEFPVGDIHSQSPSPGATIDQETRITVVTQPAGAAPGESDRAFHESFYRDDPNNPNLFRGVDESQTFRGENAPAPAGPPEPDAPPVEMPPAEAPSVNFDFGQN